MNEQTPGARGRFLFIQALTLARIPLALLFAALLYFDHTSPWAIVAGTFLLTCMEVSDILDGLLARRLGIVSELGATLDPYADSISRLTVYWALASAGLTLAVAAWCMVFRDITVAYCRVVWARQGRSGSARFSGKVKAVVQGTGAFFLLLSPTLFPQSSPWLVPAVTWTVVLVTLASLAEYVGGTIRTGR